MLKSLKYWVLDVDGTLTDGGIYYSDTGAEIKKFNVKDGTGILLAQEAGMKIIVITGRESQSTKRRMRELGVDFLFQNVKNKAKFLEKFSIDYNIKVEEMGYIGDDLNDLESMRLVGFSACPADACEEVKKMADYISPVKGGYGAVREIIEYKLKENINTEVWKH